MELAVLRSAINNYNAIPELYKNLEKKNLNQKLKKYYMDLYIVYIIKLILLKNTN